MQEGGKDMEINYKAIGNRIRATRTQKGYSQEQLANLAELTPAHISHIENGHTKLSLPAIVGIANALEVTVDQLLYDNVHASYNAYDIDFKNLIDDCTTKEKQVILESARAMKEVLKSYKL